MKRIAYPATAVALAAALLVGGCSREEAEQPTAPAAGGISAKKPYDPATSTGVITGRVVYPGDVPEPRVIRMDADPYCAQANVGAAARAAYQVGSDGALGEAFVYVSSGVEQYTFEVPDEAVVLDQQKCSYSPKVIGVRVGQPLEIRNSDATLHNVHALPQKADGFNIGMPTKGMSAVRKFSKPEVLVRVKCDVHPWMEAFVGVVEHPFFSITGADGTYRLTGLPAGEYTVTAFHYALGGNVRKVTIEQGGEATADFQFSD